MLPLLPLQDATLYDVRTVNSGRRITFFDFDLLTLWSNAVLNPTIRWPSMLTRHANDASASESALSDAGLMRRRRRLTTAAAAASEAASCAQTPDVSNERERAMV